MVTEMVSLQGLVRNRLRTARVLERWGGEHPIGAQLYGSDAGVMAEAAGADAIFLHGRVASVRHSGPSDWNLIAEVKRARKIPVIGNGGVKNAADVFHMVRETGVDGVMVGRVALGHPWLFRDIRDLAAGREPRMPTVEEVRATIHEHLRREMELMARRGAKDLKLGVELTACLVLRPHLVRYLRGFRDFGVLARTLEERQDSQTLLGRVDTVLASGRKRAGENSEFRIQNPE